MAQSWDNHWAKTWGKQRNPDAIGERNAVWCGIDQVSEYKCIRQNTCLLQDLHNPSSTTDKKKCRRDNYRNLHALDSLSHWLLLLAMLPFIPDLACSSCNWIVSENYFLDLKNLLDGTFAWYFHMLGKSPLETVHHWDGRSPSASVPMFRQVRKLARTQVNSVMPKFWKDSHKGHFSCRQSSQ